MSETPIVPLIFEGYGITWSVTSGGEDTTEEITNLSDPLPFDPDDITSDIKPPDPFINKFQWDSVELKYSIFEDDIEPLGRFNVKASVFGYTTTQSNIGGEDIINTYQIPYELTDLTITSEDPNDGGTWIFPDDYPEQVVDANHPTQYGGVIMRDGDPGMYRDGTTADCGLEDGPENDCIVPWSDTNRKHQEAISAYNYIDVFDETEFTFIPMNSNDTLDLKDNEKFRFTPLYPDVLDENGKHAPIYPMNSVTTFKPDGRNSVTVTYTAKIQVKFTAGPNKGKTIPLDNPEATIKQICLQDVSDYAKQMEQLFRYCNWSNPGGHSNEELAPRYPLAYPYTNINGFEGLGVGQTPETRGDDKENAPLERGDIWYNPETEERKYYNISDVPQGLEVTEGGGGYKDRKAVVCVWLPPSERCYKITDQTNLPFGLLCDIKTKDGEVVEAVVSNTGSPSGWSDGYIVAITGGKNNARAKISIKDEPGWIDTYVEVY